MKKQKKGLAFLFCMFAACACAAAGCGKADSADTASGDAVPDTDDQTGFRYKEAAASEDGYYFNCEGELFYYETESGQFLPLCGKASCEHNTSDCDAILPLQFYSDIYWNDGNIYVIGNEDDDSKERWLYRIEPDGSGRTKLVSLFSVGDDGAISYEFMIHRGYAYYCVFASTVAVKETNSLYRVKLESGAKPEAIDSLEAYDASFMRLRGDGDAVYYERYWIEDGDVNQTDSELVRYDCESGDIRVVYEEPVHDFAVDGDIIYVDNKTELVALDQKTGEQRTVYAYMEDDEDAPYINFVFDGTYFYIDNYSDIYVADMSEADRTIRVVDTDGTLVGTVPVGTAERCLFGEGTYFVFYSQDGETIRLLDKNSLTEKPSWTELDVAAWR